jgi:hypothetical protein
MPTNGSKVSQKQFYDELRATELRLADKIDGVLVAVHENRTITATALATLTKADDDFCRRLNEVDGKGGSIEQLHGHVDDLRIADKRWGGLAALIAALGTFLAAILNRS